MSQRGDGGIEREHDQDYAGDTSHGPDGHVSEEALSADHRKRGDGPESEDRARGDAERVVIVGGEIGGQDLGEVTPLRDEDHDERGRQGPPMGQRLSCATSSASSSRLASQKA